MEYSLEMVHDRRILFFIISDVVEPRLTGSRENSFIHSPFAACSSLMENKKRIINILFA